VAEGDASVAILRLAQAAGCDLIVMGTHGRTGLGRLLAGSVAEEVLRKAACPVMAVKTPIPATAPPEASVLAKPGEIVDVRPLGSALAYVNTKPVLRGAEVEVLRLVVPSRKELPQHQAKGEVVVHCLEGKVAFSALGTVRNLEAGSLLYLPAGEPHSVKGIEDASLLVTILLPKH
jgi:quercetin dioxygenase-like cupin family protein